MGDSSNASENFLKAGFWYVFKNAHGLIKVGIGDGRGEDEFPVSLDWHAL